MTITRKQSPAGTSDFRSVARALTIVENDLDGADDLLKGLDLSKDVPVIGITGPPGAGKSTLVSSILGEFTARGNKVAVLAVDPTSPFNFGSLLGDRIRMSPYFNHPDVFIRSLATRGSLGGLSAKTIEMTDVLKASGFDQVLIETVGVGQSEIEIAGLADITLVVLVPEGGDEIQSIKSGLMEIADAFIVNKADREGADIFANNLKKMVQQKDAAIPVFKTIASQNSGVGEVVDFITSSARRRNSRKELLLSEKALNLIRQKRMANISKSELQKSIAGALGNPSFNLYKFIEKYI
ncbi:methylmalonyl Co-A mutase-associated GTPase MeaB [Mucilaginibacter ginsenosidivorans]|uniref:Methylmalonyl Co-A mutase-associated GTPase MeaB n=1 Tax=Mucilaginibacter ginsenosidivorans TaxID=398053 RepID=A0A5B8UQP6_9SPHI|nr:methylmalonyl Co-A mutase-associated GTPase MeaB [Mucilaginibacter ginsenosidivorans]QEC61212.1 methylmalonyl Co-A mutase-associated GTPase MeaB [Mucilaginibacter ginsenosidivorans]